MNQAVLRNTVAAGWLAIAAVIACPRPGLPSSPFNQPDPRIIQEKLEQGGAELASQVLEIAKTLPGSPVFAIHGTRWYEFGNRSACKGPSFPLHSLYPKAQVTVEQRLRSFGMRTVDEHALEMAKQSVLSHTEQVLWDEAGIVAAATIAKVGKAAGATHVIWLEKEQFTIFDTVEITEAEVRVIDAGSGVTVGTAYVRTDLPSPCPQGPLWPLVPKDEELVEAVAVRDPQPEDSAEVYTGRVFAIDLGNQRLMMEICYDEKDRTARRIQTFYFDEHTNVGSLKTLDVGDCISAEAKAELGPDHPLGTGWMILVRVQLLEKNIMEGEECTCGSLGQRPDPLTEHL